MGNIEEETLDEIRGELFARWFERALTNISDLIGEIGSVVGPEFRFEGGMYVTCTKVPEFMPKDKLQELFAAVVAAFGEIEPDELKAAIEQVENFKEPPRSIVGARRFCRFEHEPPVLSLLIN